LNRHVNDDSLRESYATKHFSILFAIFFNNEHLISIWFFLLIETEFDLKITFRISNPENHQVYGTKMKICKILLFSKAISVSLAFQYQSKIYTILYLLHNFSYIYAWSKSRHIICRKIYYYCLGYWSWWKIW